MDNFGLDKKIDYAMPSRGVAAICKVGRNGMLRYLRQQNILDKNNLPTDKFWYSAWFTVKEGKHFKKATYWTLEGLEGTKKIIAEAVAKKELSYIEPKKPSYKELKADFESRINLQRAFDLI